jgi:hypothetical protein
MRRFPGGSHPPSDVLIEKLATGAVEADPSRMMLTAPPLVQTLKNEAYDPVPLIGSKVDCMVRDELPAILLPISGKSEVVKPSPRSHTPDVAFLVALVQVGLLLRS